jgi:D-sedoheptulose 7-phosphate isomerase
MKNSFSENFFKKTLDVSKNIDTNQIEKLIQSLKKVKTNKGRLFFLGIGGSAANASHAVNDFRKLCEIECYTPTDNVAELSARINDEGWDTSLLGWLKVSKFNKKDAIFIFSVGGGNIKKNVSVNLIKPIMYAKKIGAKVFGVVGRDGGFTKQKGNNVILIPNVDKKLVTPFTEAFQAVVWHCIVSHPLLQSKKTKW